jgi:hypothetical protein
MLHVLYILAFTTIAFLAIGNLIRSLISLSSDTQRIYPNTANTYDRRSPYRANVSRLRVTHPELLDENGNPIDEPLLVMRSVSVEDARQQLDSLYNSSPSKNLDKDDK